LTLSELRAGLVGFGEMGRHHARVLRSLDGVHLVGICDPATSPNDAGCPVDRTLERLLERGLDLCVVASPTTAHLEHGLILAEAGVHTLIEKPVSLDHVSAMRLAQAFDAAALIGAVGHIERFNPALQALRARLAAGELGEIYHVATRRQGPFPTRVLDVGVVLDLATHDIDSTAWVSQQRYASVSARVAHRSGRRHEDLVSIVATLTDGTVVNHLVNWLSPLKERLTVVSGELGSFVADTVNADLTFYANGAARVEWEALKSFHGVVQGDVIQYAIPKPEPLAVELAAFRDAVLGVADDIVTLHEAAEVVRVASAVAQSAASGTTIAL
jgi:UDP-N-acetylglucosamine 3-dehydrogenase